MSFFQPKLGLIWKFFPSGAQKSQTVLQPSASGQSDSFGLLQERISRLVPPSAGRMLQTTPGASLSLAQQCRWEACPVLCEQLGHQQLQYGRGPLQQEAVLFLPAAGRRKLSQLSQQRDDSLRPRLKLLARLQMRQFKECLRMFSNSLMVMLGKRQSLTTCRVIFILL